MPNCLALSTCCCAEVPVAPSILPPPAPRPQIIKAQDPNVVVTVDNCYGEFTDTREPCDVGADLAMGSLIKNPGRAVRGCVGIWRCRVEMEA